MNRNNYLPILIVLAVLFVSAAVAVGLRYTFHGWGEGGTPPAVVDVSPEEPAAEPKHFVQFASLRTKDQAKRALVDLERYSDLFDTSLFEIYQVEIRGVTWFRVMLAMKDRASADRLCAIVKDRGGDCLALSFD